MTRQLVIDSLCAELKIPGIGGAIERTLVTKTISAVYDHVPPFLWDVVISGADGFTPQEVDSLIGTISQSVARYVKVSWLPESIKQEVVREDPHRVLHLVKRLFGLEESAG